jgi:hypothetical protein
MGRQGSAVSSLQTIQPGTPASKQWIVVEDALRTEQSLDPVGMFDALGEQRLPFSAEASTIFLLRRRRPDHRTHPRLTALEGQKCPHERFAVDPIRLRLAPTARRQDRSRVDDMALNPFAPQDPMDPEPVQAGLLNRDDREGSVQTSDRLLLKLSELRQQAADIASRDRVRSNRPHGGAREGRDKSPAS